MEIKYSLDEYGKKYIPVTHKKAVKGINLDILDNFSDNEGNIRALQDFDFNNINKYIKSGFYYVKSAKNSPDSEHSTGYLQVMSRSTTYKKIIFIPFNQNRIYLRHELGKDIGWTGWTVIRNQKKAKSIINDDGNIPSIENVDLESMDKIKESGFFYLKSVTNSPESSNSNGYIIVLSNSSTYKKVLFMPFNKNRLYSRNMMGSSTGWGNWYRIGGEGASDSISDLYGDNGFINTIDGLDFKSMESFPNNTGNYYLTNIKNSPDSIIEGYVSVFAKSAGDKKVLFYPSDTNRIYTKSQDNNNWKDWIRIDNEDLSNKINELEKKIEELNKKIN